MSIKAYLVINVNRPRQLKRQLSRSFVRNLLALLGGWFSAGGFYITNNQPISDGYEPVRLTDSRQSVAYRSIIIANAPAGNDTFGIVVGSGSAPVGWSDYNLASKTPHSSTGLAYGSSTYTGITDEPNGGLFRIVRTFTNNGATPVTITEVGLVLGIHSTNPLLYPAPVLIARDLLSTPVTIAPNATATIRYIIRVIM
jgi:hypothetical protein